MTFAYHLPHAATGSAENSRDYALGHSLVGIWGRPHDVAAAIDTQNLTVRALVQERQDILFVDQQSRIPKDSSHFRDCCHLTRAGCEAFAGNILEAFEGTEPPAPSR